MSSSSDTGVFLVSIWNGNLRGRHTAGFEAVADQHDGSGHSGLGTDHRLRDGGPAGFTLLCTGYSSGGGPDQVGLQRRRCAGCAIQT